MSNQLPPLDQRTGRLEITPDSLPPVASPQPSAGAPAQTSSSTASPVWAGVPLPAAKPQAVPGMSAFCHACGNRVDPRAVICTACGVPQQAAAMSQTHAMANVALNNKSSGMAILLSLLFTGAGQWYMGRVGRGFAFFGAALVSAVLMAAAIGFVLLPVVWVWAAIDANKLANEHNAALLTQVTGVV